MSYYRYKPNNTYGRALLKTQNLCWTSFSLGWQIERGKTDGFGKFNLLRITCCSLIVLFYDVMSLMAS